MSIMCFFHENPGILWPSTPVQGNEKHFDVILGVVNTFDDEIEFSNWFFAKLQPPGCCWPQSFITRLLEGRVLLTVVHVSRD